MGRNGRNEEAIDSCFRLNYAFSPRTSFVMLGHACVRNNDLNVAVLLDVVVVSLLTLERYDGQAEYNT